jgi:hypothetical protein
VIDPKSVLMCTHRRPPHLPSLSGPDGSADQSAAIIAVAITMPSPSPSGLPHLSLSGAIPWRGTYVGIEC